MNITTDIKPKEITKDCDTGVETASFDYYDGFHLAKEKNWKQTTSMNDLNKLGNFIVCCGDVMIRVLPIDYPEIERRLF